MLGEFEFIHNIKKKYRLEKVGDDCAVLPKDDETDQVITTDLLIEDIDFRLEWTEPEYLGHKALAVSLSDIAAMGAEPKWAMLSLGVSEKLWKSDFIDRFYIGWFALAQEFNVELVGGDVSRTPDKIVIDSIVSGEVPKGKAILRSGAKVGDAIYVTGELGAAAAGLWQLKNGITSQSDFVAKQLKPPPVASVPKQLQSLGAIHSMIDISDGLSSDLAHVCDASDVGAKIYSDQIPIEPELVKQFGADQSFDFALNGGEDFELLFTAAENFLSPPQSVRISKIGEITSDRGKIELIRDGRTGILQPKGYQHF
jgi:thiamine-monophosphate kinase